MGCGVLIRVGAATLTVGGAAAVGQVLNFDVEFSGEINGDPIVASGQGQLDRRGQGENFGQIFFEALPDDFSPFAVDAMLTNVCPNGFRADEGSQNLWDLGGGTYQIERTFQWIGFPGDTIIATADISFDEDSQTIFSSMTMNGVYSGPTDIVGIDSYNVLWLPSSAEGEIFEAGTAVLRRANDEQVIVQFATRYFGLRDSLENSQSGTGSLDATFDGQVLSLGWDGQFEVVPAPGTLSLGLIGAALLVPRRRR